MSIPAMVAMECAEVTMARRPTASGRVAASAFQAMTSRQMIPKTKPSFLMDASLFGCFPPCGGVF
jgi:hypothetical protein